MLTGRRNSCGGFQMPLSRQRGACNVQASVLGLPATCEKNLATSANPFRAFRIQIQLNSLEHNRWVLPAGTRIVPSRFWRSS